MHFNPIKEAWWTEELSEVTLLYFLDDCFKFSNQSHAIVKNDNFHLALDTVLFFGEIWTADYVVTGDFHAGLLESFIRLVQYMIRF
jgi:hypothetical protein